MQEHAVEFEDNITMILEWDDLNPPLSISITVIPETQININASSSTAHLTFAYNVIYNVSVIISNLHPCEENNLTVFSEVYYYNIQGECYLPHHNVITD